MNTRDETSTGICDFFGCSEFFRFDPREEKHYNDPMFWSESGLVGNVLRSNRAMTEHEMIRKIYPAISDNKFHDMELMKALFPSIDNYVEAILSAVAEPQYFPTELGTLTVGFCIKDEALHVVHTYQSRQGLNFRYLPASLERSWDATVLLVEASTF